MNLHRSRVIAAVAVVVAAVTVITATVRWWPGRSEAESPPSMPPETTAPPASTVPPSTDAPETPLVDKVVRATFAGTASEPTLVASFAQDIPRFDSPDGDQVGEVPAEWLGRPSILPVIDQQPEWLEVRLAQRPNGSTAWVRRDDVALASTPYRVLIDVARTRLHVYEKGAELLDAPAGLGTDDAPTTVGNFFVTFMQEPPNSSQGWGPFIVVTSSHSETISDFQSSGDAIAAIHGPLGTADEIGETGAYVSHGCIRLHFDDLDVLRDLPVGTPIDVIDTGDNPFASMTQAALREVLALK